VVVEKTKSRERVVRGGFGEFEVALEIEFGVSNDSVRRGLLVVASSSEIETRLLVGCFVRRVVRFEPRRAVRRL